MLIAWLINLNVSCKLHPNSLQRIRSPPRPGLPKWIRNTRPRNYYDLKGKDIDIYLWKGNLRVGLSLFQDNAPVHTAYVVLGEKPTVT